jgi:hypothetical protein
MMQFHETARLSCDENFFVSNVLHSNMLLNFRKKSIILDCQDIELESGSFGENLLTKLLGADDSKNQL